LIASLDVSVVIPGHGRVFTDAAGALERAYSRLDYLSSDPVRNAQNAVKVLLKFLLLERQRIALADVPALLQGMPLFGEANRRFLHQETIALADWAVSQLIKANAVCIEGEYLLNDV